MHYAARLTALLLLAICFRGSASAQSPGITPPPTPESGFVTSTHYTSAFFGFSLPLPQDASIEVVSGKPKDQAAHLVFGLRAAKVAPSGLFSDKFALTIFIIEARQLNGDSMEEVRKTASGSNGNPITSIQIGGREFWKSDIQKKEPEGKAFEVAFATDVNGYVVSFIIESFDQKLTDQLKHSIESITFFDPARALEMAGANSQPYPATPTTTAGGLLGDAEHAMPEKSRIATLSLGAVSGNVYSNDDLGFILEIPKDWVVNDQTTIDKKIKAGQRGTFGVDTVAVQAGKVMEQCGRNLLNANRYPQELKTKEFNSVIGAVALDLSCFPDWHFPSSADDLQQVKNAAQDLGSLFAGSLPFTQEPTVQAFPFRGGVVIEVSGPAVFYGPRHDVSIALAVR